MKKRHLRKFLNMDDSFTGDYIVGKFYGLDFDIVISMCFAKNDKYPRIHIVEYNDEHLAKLSTTRSYIILNRNKLKRITLYHKTGFNMQREQILKSFVQNNYEQILDYFYNGGLVKYNYKCLNPQT